MKNILIILIFTFSASVAYSQNNLTAIQYSMGFGTGDLSDYIDKASFRGISIDYRKMVQPNVGVGVDLGWNVFYDERADDTYELGKLTYSGKQFRYNNQFPVLVAADYYFQPGEKVNPFAGLGTGIMFSNRKTDMGVYSFSQEAVNFTLRPEIGVLYNLNTKVGFKLSGKYYYGFEAGELPAQSYYTLNLGIVLIN
ncbi:outer membrane beta-barrel protein [Algoriphagus resistens]|uniref:outer membrane beta-barrel protein n=1 Tax=Algoriphagus resistens TaxID=1750590 RepID=UPI0007168F1C|nr:outer membrane beta-barrel protein [Algoriphagus resistens]